MENQVKSLQYLTVISSTKNKEKILKLLREQSAEAVNVIYGKGSVKESLLAQAFGLDWDSKKAVITGIIETDMAKEVIEILKDKYNFNKANTGIAFSISVDGLLF